MIPRLRRGAAVLALGACLAALAVAPARDGGAEATRAPRFKARDLRGGKLDLAALTRRGPVLLDFWATWCKPCLASLPELEAWHREYGPRGLTVVGVSLDGPRNRTKVRPFVTRLGLTYPVVIDEDGRIQELYRVIALPTAVLIDTTGAVAKVRIGYRAGEGADLEEAIRALLALEPAAAADGAAAPDTAAGGAAGPR